MGGHIVIAPGSINVDLILKTDVLRGPKTFQGRYCESQGGKGANQAVAARRASVGDRGVHLLGCVGDDDWGAQSLASLRAAGVDTGLVRTTDRCRTGVVMEYLYGDGEVTIGLGLGANDEVRVADVDAARSVIEDAALLMTQIENPLDAVTHALGVARDAGVVTFLDPSVVPEGDRRRRLDAEVLPRVDIIAPNRSEAQALSGIGVVDDDSALAAAHALAAQASVVVLTRGGDGAVLVRGDEARIVRGLTVAAIDGGAAGDTFRGALGTALVEAMESANVGLAGLAFDALVHAVRFANAAAALCVTRPGAYPAIPLRAEIDTMMESVS